MSWFPGLASWATFSRPFGTGPDTPDSCIDVKENRVELVDRLAAFACGPSETAGPYATPDFLSSLVALANFVRLSESRIRRLGGTTM
jgi:hypothetical protein